MLITVYTTTGGVVGAHFGPEYLQSYFGVNIACWHKDADKSSFILLGGGLA
jgi:hypothetical protein